MSPHDAEGRPAWDDGTAEWYVKRYGEHATNRLAVEAAQLSADDVVVDVGCGSGAAVRAAAALVPEGRVLGVDPVSAMVRIARERTVGHEGAERIAFVEAPAEALPLDDASATVVLAVNSVHHWRDRTKGLSEVARALASGGRFVVCDDEGPAGHPAATPELVGGIEVVGLVDVSVERTSAGGDPTTLVVARLP